MATSSTTKKKKGRVFKKQNTTQNLVKVRFLKPFKDGLIGVEAGTDAVLVLDLDTFLKCKESGAVAEQIGRVKAPAQKKETDDKS